jgi:hypothetical protein
MAEIGFEIFYLDWIAAEEPNRDDYRGLIVCGCQKLARKPGSYRPVAENNRFWRSEPKDNRKLPR